MSNKSYGLGYERKEKKYLTEQGYTCFRQRGSFGIFDIVAFSKFHWLVESIKSTRKDKYYANKEIEKLKKIVVPANTLKRLVVYIKGKRQIAYSNQDWEI